MTTNRALATLALLLAAALGSAANLHAQLGPILRVVPPSFDTTRCGTSECRTMTFENIGDAPLRLLSVAQIASPFSGSIPVPFTLVPGERRSFQICYSPVNAPARDTQIVSVRGNGRVSLSIAMLFDTSGSMGSSIGGIGGDTSTVTTARIVAANAAGRRFVQTLVDTLGIRDTVAVCRFSDGYAVTQGFTTDKAVLSGAIPSGTGGRTCLYRAIIQTAGILRTQNTAGRRVMIVLADGADDGCAGTTLADVMGSCTAPDPIRVFTVAIGAADAGPLQQIAAVTNGKFFTASDEGGLMAVYDSIAVLLSQDTLEQGFRMTARAVTPVMQVTPAAVEFDSVRIGTSACRQVVITNTGDAPLDVTSISGFNGDFALMNPAIPTVLPGESAEATVCFTPARLRARNGGGSFAYTGCGPLSEALTLRGVGYDSLVLAVRDSISARPGSYIEIPVYLREPIPSHYGVNRYEVAISYNKTMLYPADTFELTAGTLSEGFQAAMILTGYDGTTATTRATFDGGASVLSSPDSNGILVRFRFLVLHGNALRTPVRITAARFADGNPKLGLVEPFIFQADSLCYQEQRLIDASGRYGGLLKTVTTDGSGTAGIAQYRILEPTRARLLLYDGLGREVMEISDQELLPGDYHARFAIAGLPHGVYYLRLQTAGSQDVKMMMLGNR